MSNKSKKSFDSCWKSNRKTNNAKKRYPADIKIKVTTYYRIFSFSSVGKKFNFESRSGLKLKN